MLVKWHSGGSLDPAIELEMEEIIGALQAEKEAKTTTSYADMLKTAGNRRRLFISTTLGVFAQWNGVGIVSYYLALVLATAGVTSVTDQTVGALTCRTEKGKEKPGVKKES